VLSDPLPFTVFATPSATLEASRTAFDLGQTTTLTAVGALGSGGFTYTWSGLPTGCSGPGATVDCTPTAAGTFSVQVAAKDTNGVMAESTMLVLHVAATLSATAFASTSATTVGTSVEFTGSGSGGSGTLSFAWEFGDGSSGTGSVVNHTYGRTGTFAVTLWVNDSSGGSVVKTLTVSISGSGNSAGISSTEIGELVGIAAIVAIAAVVGILLFRKQNRKGAPTEAPPASPNSPVESEEPLGEEQTPDGE
jgi:hypothetical protein